MQKGLLHVRRSIPVVQIAFTAPHRINLGQVRHASLNPMNWLRERLATQLRDEGAAEASSAAKRAARAEGQRSIFEVSQDQTKSTAVDSSTDVARTEAPETYKHPKKRKQMKKAHSHKYSTANFKISPRKLNMLGRQISGKPIDEAILQMQFSEKRASNRILNMLATARDHAVSYKGLEKPKLVISEAWVTKGKYMKRIEPRARGHFGVRTHPSARMHVVLKEGRTLDEKKAAEHAYKLNRVVSASHVREDKPIRNPGAMWTW
ncbi:hypothetical protein E1B28_004361 [Marasmius oreades]|uniref:50S ribosomal protein L22, chloroplastic n=1 Tax=Marasmius oreades TaxID=181124 RepID=A0A9P7UYD5_9AGAR|nr:uncharacterized protein E1B28_004361 [Marasmius oreades]KAG7096964.1 hypothetical protein E1B28_004361 [Marasmius oreades]